MNNTNAFAELRNTLAELYSDPISVRRLAEDAGLNSGRIDFSDHPINNWHAILLEAQKMGQLDDLLTIVRKEYKSKTLDALLSNYQEVLPQQDIKYAEVEIIRSEFTPPSTTTVSDNKITENSIVGLLVKQKFNREMNAYWVLLAVVAVNLLFVTFGFIQFNLYTLLFFIILIGLLYINQSVLRYRLAKGYYGTNEYEVREIIQFILEHSDKTDFTDGNGMKKLMPDPEVITQKGFIKGAVYQ